MENDILGISNGAGKAKLRLSRGFPLAIAPDVNPF
jgi:hypothetical protein